MKKLISICLPCRNEALNLPEIIQEIQTMVPSHYEYEIICVDDGSTDNSRQVLTEVCSRNSKVKAIFFHRRFGHQAALKAGIDFAQGAAVIIMDADFQHPPQLIPHFISAWERGHDVVQAIKNDDKTLSFFSRLVRSFGYKLWNGMSDGVLTPGGSDFRLIDKKIASFIRKSPEKEIYLRGFTHTIARNIAYIKYDVMSRKHGNSSYNSSMLINIFLKGIVTFSTKPLRIGWIIGLILCIGAGVFLITDTILALLQGKHLVEGYMTVIVLIVALNGFTIFYLGIIAEYIGVIFKEAKSRPMYMIDEKVNFTK